MRRTMIMLVFMGTTLALAAGVALAQDTRGADVSHGPIDFGLDATDCAGETIHLSGQLNSVFHVVERADGFFHVNTHFNFANVKGIGEETRVQYRVPTTVNSTQHITPGEYPIIVSTEVTMSMTIGQGQAPDQQATTVIHSIINEDGTATVEVEHFRFVCSS
jgi:hypothetical protein